MIDPALKAILTNFANSSKRMTVLSGAGISAESGIPTFRGPEGYWTIGSKVYQPQELATYTMFLNKPYDVWKWYLYRRGVCHNARPNAGHLAVVALEQRFSDRFTLITQNVDGLHLRAGNSPERTLQIHGNIHYMRCSQECSTELYPLPEGVMIHSRDEDVPEAAWQLLRCPKCNSLTRPHILWWDEYYNEEFFRFDSSLKIARETDLLLVVGTTGATNLPNQVVLQALMNGSIVIDINIERNRFSEMALESGRGYFIQQPGGLALPEIATIFTMA